TTALSNVDTHVVNHMNGFSWIFQKMLMLICHRIALHIAHTNPNFKQSNPTIPKFCLDGLSTAFDHNGKEQKGQKERLREIVRQFLYMGLPGQDRCQSIIGQHREAVKQIQSHSHL
uniref:Uncharacterized protein n=1 Tax=Acanthochromis polyacanthus TaxID=80966 RepID=A0A3Q1G226_9TELE